MKTLKVSAIPLLLVLSSAYLTTCQELTAIQSRAKLPTPRHHLATLYDGDDIIFIAGGYKGPEDQVLDEFLKYYISTDTLEHVGVLPTKRYGGKLAVGPTGGIYYCGGRTYSDILLYNPSTSIWNVVSTLPTNKAYSGLVQTRDTAYLIGGYYDPNSITLFNMTSNNATVVDSMDEMDGDDSTTAVLDGEGNAIIFSAYLNERPAKVIKYSFSTSTYRVLTNLVHLRWPSSVWDGSQIYIIGGYGYPDNPTNGILQVDAQTGSSTFIPVANFPAQDDLRFVATSSVFVEKLNRIYMFGGANSDNTLNSTRDSRDEIWWIDLDPSDATSSTTTEVPLPSTVDPDIFNCANKTDGMYPHPYGCNMFIGCRSGVSTEFTCPESLLFDPVTRTCTFAEDVECGINCLGKPNGMYPHPYDCSLFIGCHNGDTEVYKCPSPLLFDPVGLQCTFPELVICDG